jgi:hypothetical protein
MNLISYELRRCDQYGPLLTLRCEFRVDNTDLAYLFASSNLLDQPVIIIPSEYVAENGELERALADLLKRRA